MLVSPPPAQSKPELETQANPTLEQPESNAAESIPITHNQEVGKPANHQQDSNGKESVNSTMPHPPSSVPSIDTTNQLKSPPGINSPTPSNHSSYSMVNSMKTNDTSHQMIDQIVSHSPSLGNEKFFDVGNVFP